MSKYDIPPQFECQNRILNVKIQNSANFECQNRILNVKIQNSANFEFQNRILNVKIRYSAPDRMPKYDFKCKNTIFCLSSNVKIQYSARF